MPFNTLSPEGCPALFELRRQEYQGGESSVGKSIVVLSSTTFLPAKIVPRTQRDIAHVSCAPDVKVARLERAESLSTPV